MSEKSFEREIFKWLADNGVYKALTPVQNIKAKPIGWCIKNWGGGYSQSGIPDITGVINSKFFAIEVKAENGRPSKLQLKQLDEINRAGGVAMLVYPKDFEEMKLKLKELM